MPIGPLSGEKLVCRLAYLLVAALFLGCASPKKTRTIKPESSSPVLSVQPDGKTLKHRVAVGRFSNETTYGKSVLLGGDVLGKQASDILTTRLAETQKFVLFEAEGTSGSVPAEFLVVGSVSEFGRSETGSSGVFGKTKTQTARAAVNLRLVEASSGLVVFSTEGRGEAEVSTGTTLGVGTRQGFDSTLSEKAISAAISNVVGRIVDKMLDAPWRSYVLDVQGKECTIGGGASHGLTPGGKFTVLKRGRRVKNEQTGLDVELPGSPVAKLEATKCLGNSFRDEITQCRVVDGDLAGLDLSQLIVEEAK